VETEKPLQSPAFSPLIAKPCAQIFTDTVMDRSVSLPAISVATMVTDLIVGARNADPSGTVDAGKSYVVFGKTNNTAINLSAIALGTGGFVTDFY
jgi:hypothetical protein